MKPLQIVTLKKHLTVEEHVLLPEYAEMFTDE
jgi:hypothetical protein